MSGNKQKPFSNYNLKNKKTPVPRTPVQLTGYLANSFNGGHNKTIAYKQVFAGERHKEYKVRLNMKMLTPLTPTYQALKCTIRAYFVPNSRVWDNAEAFQAQNPSNANTPKCYPNLSTVSIPFLGSSDEGITYPITNTQIWRDLFISSYVPRLFSIDTKEDTHQNIGTTKSDQPYFPKINALPLRGRVAIFNDYERNKEYQTEIEEYKNDEVTYEELQNYLPIDPSTGEIDPNKWFVGGESSNSDFASPRNLDYYQMRAKKDDSYYTDYRTNVGGFDTGFTNANYYMIELENADSVDNIEVYNKANAARMSIFTWNEWENKIAEARSQAENANLTDWQIIAKIRGSKLLTEGKVQLIGQKTFNLNNKAVTQTSNNNADGVDPMYKSMGTQGAYSYTEIEVPVYSGMEFNEDGFVHIIATVSADTVYESGIDATLLNVEWDEQYRPDAKEQKTGVLRYLEMGTDLHWNGRDNRYIFLGGNERDDKASYSAASKIIGYKRRFNEYFKLPNCIGGDMTTNDWLCAQTAKGDSKYAYSTFANDTIFTDDPMPVSKTQKTFQFFENSPDSENMQYVLPVNAETWIGLPPSNSQKWIGKKIWYDYTDLQINANQAVENPIVITNGADSCNIYVSGQNQIFFVGVASCDAILPINWEVKENATDWGEH